MLLSDELAKHDTASEQAVNKTADVLATLVKGQPDALVQDFLLVNDSTFDIFLQKLLYIMSFNANEKKNQIETVDQYISTFQWNSMKYRTDKSLQETTALLTQVMFIYNIYSERGREIELLNAYVFSFRKLHPWITLSRIN